ncbi:MAG: D-alanyl-D-alanine carboxypeptidase family protein [Clostridia bacterium]|nr:D-alanyl-D-alanine carboxypeptidase family protein [Clostridia bacterium]
MFHRLIALLFAAALLILPPACAAAEDDSQQERFVAPELPEGAIPYDEAHPELLDADMLYAQSAILIEADTGEVIFEKNADVMMYPASTTKILTAYIALQMADLENDVVTVSQNAIDLVPSGYQTIPLVAGEKVNMLDLVSAMLVRSGNEAANAIAEYLGGGSIDTFVDLMNQTAQMLGCSSDTHFSNPSGLHEETHYVTARDMAIIARAAMRNENFRSIVCKTSYDMPASEKEDGSAAHPRRTIVGSTAILDPQSSYYYSYAIGVKTGFTIPAGYCFVGAANKGGIELISVVLYDGDTRRYIDTKRLFEYGYTQIESISPESLYAESPRVIDITGFALDDESHGELTLGIRAVDDTKDMTIVGNKSSIDILRENFSQVSSIRWTREFRAPVNVGDVMGILTFYSENNGTAEYELVATRSIAAREDAPPTLEQIVAYTNADENPWPRFSWDLLVPPAAALLLFILLVRFIQKHHKKRSKAPKIKPIKKRYLR